MNNKPTTYCLLLLLPALMLISCTQDEENLLGTAGKADDSTILFSVTMPDADRRSSCTTMTGNLSDGFYVSAICPEDDAAAGNTLNAYFTEQFATRLDEMPGHFGMFDQSSEQWMWPTTRHGKQGRLKFFAFYPSREVLSRDAAVELSDGYFGLKNSSTKLGTEVTYDYRMSKFNINNDISRHTDFVTATAEGSKKANGETGVDVSLAFEHQLSRVTLKAWGNIADNNSGFANIEIAGVRIGCAVVESDFNFAEKPTNYASGDRTTTGNWVAPQVKGVVEYIYREGDIVIRLDGGSYKTADAATSIMGNGGWAMVIPADYIGWNKNNQGLYFSVLLRVKGKDKNNTLLYPYVEGAQMSGTTTTDNMNVIYLSVDRTTGEVMKRLYKDGPQFFTDPGHTQAYTAPDTEEIRNYGWAAIPLTDLSWKPGYQYTYTLNYTDGVGVEDPADLFPGKPIISKISVAVTEGTTTWPMVYDFKNEEEDGVDVTDKITIE
ncbi:MAG: fimbrillin family protein [Muribaculaceae bacterium]|nr:fimbrillin family protein [Muribaculaceae bacterium]